MTMSSIGLPGLNGFIGEFAILQGAFQAAPWIAVLATTGIILGAAYMLWLYQRAMFGPISEVNTKMADLNARELAYFAPAARWRPSGSASTPSRSWTCLTSPWPSWSPRSTPTSTSRQALTAAQQRRRQGAAWPPWPPPEPSARRRPRRR